jgi:hypothetical protein
MGCQSRETLQPNPAGAGIADETIVTDVLSHSLSPPATPIITLFVCRLVALEERRLDESATALLGRLQAMQAGYEAMSISGTQGIDPEFLLEFFRFVTHSLAETNVAPGLHIFRSIAQRSGYMFPPDCPGGSS